MVYFRYICHFSLKNHRFQAPKGDLAVNYPGVLSPFNLLLTPLDGLLVLWVYLFLLYAPYTSVIKFRYIVQYCLKFGQFLLCISNDVGVVTVLFH